MFSTDMATVGLMSLLSPDLADSSVVELELGRTICGP